MGHWVRGGERLLEKVVGVGKGLCFRHGFVTDEKLITRGMRIYGEWASFYIVEWSYRKVGGVREDWVLSEGDTDLPSVGTSSKQGDHLLLSS